MSLVQRCWSSHLKWCKKPIFQISCDIHTFYIHTHTFKWHSCPWYPGLCIFMIFVTEGILLCLCYSRIWAFFTATDPMSKRHDPTLDIVIQCFFLWCFDNFTWWTPTRRMRSLCWYWYFFNWKSSLLFPVESEVAWIAILFEKHLEFCIHRFLFAENKEA